MDAVGQYLILPRQYCDWLGGLRWSASDDTIIYPDGDTFAFNEEIALFLEGFANARALIHFGHVVHALDLLRPFPQGKRPATTESRRLYQALRETGGALRNAGAFMAVLCRELPAAPGRPSVLCICDRLRSCIIPIRWHVAQFNDTLARAEVPPLEPEEFETHIHRHLRSYTEEELRHWLRHGQGSVKEPAEEIIRQIPPPLPRTLPQMLASLLELPRLAGAAPWVDALVSALVLPRRRLEHEQFPMGGYVDVTMRGPPDRILPHQFVLDEEEFLRRFAERELLYYRREEPHTQVKEELAVLLDQGVRTWGTVRLVLAAAAIALGRLAHRRRVRFLISGTSVTGRLIDPLATSDAEFGQFAEASDLTANPGVALESVLEASTDAARDIVLLTHPRNLAEPDVAAAACRLSENSRLFGVALDDRGSGRLCEMKHGRPVTVTQFCVDLSRSAPAAASRPESADEFFRPRDWTGDVEPIGFPFRFGITGSIGKDLFDFDYEGNWLLTVSTNGMLHVWSTTSEEFEVLPRCMVNGTVLTQIRQVKGVAGGFVLVAEIERKLVLAHYDLSSRKVAVHPRARPPAHRGWVKYYRRYHSLRIFDGDVFGCAIDLSTGDQYPKPEWPNDAQCRWPKSGSRSETVYHLPWDQSCQVEDERHIEIREQRYSTPPYWHYLLADYKTGELAVEGTARPWQPFVPLLDGQPMLKYCSIVQSQYRENTLAILVKPKTGGKRRLYAFRAPEGQCVLERPYAGSVTGFVLSADGRYVACQVSQNQIAMYDTETGSSQLTRRGGCHNSVHIVLGVNGLRLSCGKHCHFLTWRFATLEHVYGGVRDVEPLKFNPDSTLVGSRVLLQILPRSVHYDSKRFISGAQMHLCVIGDCFGQVAVLDPRHNLIAMFFVYKNHLAGWMPDGTWYGPAHLTGSVPTPNAAERIGRALRNAINDPVDA
jgi:hypothetical protein